MNKRGDERVKKDITNKGGKILRKRAGERTREDGLDGGGLRRKASPFELSD